MASYETNPFQELYVTDHPDPNTFVALFSEFPVQHALALFRPGHVVLKGTQGSGKSMLLNLFRTQIRLAYHRVGATFPVPQDLRGFIGAGINLTRSGVLDIGNRPLSADAGHDDALFPLYFADFVNYYVVRDILDSVNTMRDNSAAFDDIVAGERLDHFARALADDDCWFGALQGCDSISTICDRIDERVNAYRSFHLYNLRELPAAIDRTKTTIGEPIARAAELLRELEVVPDGTPVFVRIDQVERLYRSDAVRPEVGGHYRRIVNKAIGLRDSRVWYRVGTRQYAWDGDLRMFGTNDKLEHLRDFRFIDLDDMLRRKEAIKTWIFPKFVEDAFCRRLKQAEYRGAEAHGLVRLVFGATEDPSSAATDYARNSTAQRVLKLTGFSPAWHTFLTELCSVDPLSAVLAAAWARQRGTAGKQGDRLKKPPPIASEPWKRPYWRKERIRQALLQIAARSAQRLKWSGQEHILALSAGNISIFLSICHEVWDAFLRAERRKPSERRRDPIAKGMDPDVQAVGIQTASAYWYDKITEQPKGDDRQRFLDEIAREFRSWLVDDDSMSYPGHNGFSVAIDELDRQPAIASFLGDSSDYGDLYEVPHTTKDKNRKQRKKWYLSPILSVYYQVPESHVKEPFYATGAKVAEWIDRAGIVLEGRVDQSLTSESHKLTRPRDDSPTLFDGV
ncbi:MAG: hypothetical protein HOP29_04255 [Phycisphaerales bacterium]|nr:hypothetical protein [Phycisphaerales bacterium]